MTHYPYDLEGRLLGEYDEEGYVQREYVYLDGMPLAQWAPTHDRFEGTEIYYYHLPLSQRALHLEETYGLHGNPRFK